MLVVGAGTIGELVAEHLAKRGVHELLVLGRDVARAERLAQRHGGRAVRPGRLGEGLALADVVISAYRRAASPAPCAATTSHPTARGRCWSSTSRSPADVEPAVAHLTGVELYTGDDLREHVERTLPQRGDHLPAARTIVSAEVARFTRWLSRRELVPA